MKQVTVEETLATIVDAADTIKNMHEIRTAVNLIKGSNGKRARSEDGGGDSKRRPREHCGKYHKGKCWTQVYGTFDETFLVRLGSFF